MRILVFFVAFLLDSALLSAQQNLSILPLKPSPGGVIQIEYVPSGDIANTTEKVEALIYLTGQSGRVAKDLVLTKSGKKYTATIQTDTSNNFIELGFYVGNKFDNNFNEGYFIQLYDGEKIRKDSYFNLGLFYQFFGGFVGVEANPNKAMAAMKDEMTLYPEQKRKVIPYYYGRLMQIKSAEAMAQIQLDIESTLKTGLKTEEDYDQIVALYNAAGLQEQAKVFEELQKAKFPQGRWVMARFIERFIEEKEPAKKAALYREIEQNIKTDKNWNAFFKNSISYFRSVLINSYLAAQDWETVKRLTSEIPDKAEAAGIYNNVAWELQGKNSNLKMAEEFARIATNHAANQRKKSLMIIDKEGKTKGQPSADISQSTSTKPNDVTPKQWAKQQEDNYAMYADTYAMVLYRLGNFKKGLEYAKEIAFLMKKGEDAHANSTYALLAQKVLPGKTLKPQFEEMVRSGHNNIEVNEALRVIYLDEKNSEKDFDQYLAELGKQNYLDMMKEVKNSIIKEAAPSFSLLDLNGQQVNLANLKGKTVIVDFWATWCGPCKESFPGLQRMVNKFKDNLDVKFLFVNTLERGDENEKGQKVSGFMKQYQYTFQVLMDNDNKVVKDYGVLGIPTKFIIDKNGDIRFKSIGFNGSDEKLVNELTAMIELLNN
jgi:thiol-disulfide isomerase/thioredoxin